MKFLTLFVLSAGLVFLTPMVVMADCYDGCIDYAVSVNDGIYVVDGTSEECVACSGGDTYSYSIDVYEDGCYIGDAEPAHFCTTASDITSGWYFVQAIGAGCPTYPQGCVRICPCP